MGNRYGGTGQDAKVAPPAVSSPTIDFRYFRFNLLFIQLAPSAGFCGQLHLCKLHVFFYIGQGCERTYFKVYLLQTCTTQLWEANVNMDAPLLPYLGTPFCLGTSSSSMDALRNWSRSDLKWTLACAVEQKKKSTRHWLAALSITFMMPWLHTGKAFRAHLGVKRMQLSIAEEQCANSNW